MINGTKIYVDALDPKIKKVIFTIYDPNDVHYWDHHFHFGIRNNFSNNDNNLHKTDVIYFHKTSQDPKNKSQKNCYFTLDVNIDDIGNIKCVQQKNDRMKKKFSNEDLKLIKGIIRLPFGIPATGGKPRNKTSKNRLCKKPNKTIRRRKQKIEKIK